MATVTSFPLTTINTITATGGATGRSLADRFAEEMSVLDFGAVGDCTGPGVGTDDTTEIQAALDWVVAADFRKLVFPNGKRYRVSSALTADFDGKRGCNISMFGPITPDETAFDALTIKNLYQGYLALRVEGGGVDADYSQSDPAGGSQCFVIQSSRRCTIDVIGHSHAGRVFRTKSTSGTYKLSFLDIHIDCGDITTSPGSTQCGQACYIQGTTAFGRFRYLNSSWSKYSPVFYNTTDISVLHIEAGAGPDVLSPVTFKGCGSVWMGIVSLGDESSTQTLLEFASDDSGNRSNRIHIDKLLGVESATVLKATGVRYGLTINKIIATEAAEVIVDLDDVADAQFYCIEGTNSDKAIRLANGCCNISARLAVEALGKQAVVIDSTCFDLEFSGFAKTGSGDAPGTYAAVDCDSTLSGIKFLNFDVLGTGWSGAYDLPVGNKVEIIGGKLSVTTQFVTALPNAAILRNSSANGGWNVLGRTSFSQTSILNSENTAVFYESGTNRPYAVFQNETTGSSATDGTWLGFSDGNGAFHIRQRESQPVTVSTSDTERLRIDAAGNVVVNTAAISTSATDGFLYIPGSAGTPSGTPTSLTGRVPFTFDTSNGIPYFYSGAWRPIARTDLAQAWTAEQTFTNTGLHILDTNATHDLIVKPGSDLSSDRTLTLTTGDSDRTITVSGDVTLNDWFNQSVKSAASPTFVGLTLSGALQSTSTANFATTVQVSRSGAGPAIQTYRTDAHGAAAIGRWDIIGRNTTPAQFTYAQITGDVLDNTAASEDATVSISTAVAGTVATRVTVGQGVFHPSATGGDKGVNTINFGAVYDDNTLLTDYVFDKWLGDQSATYSERVAKAAHEFDSGMLDHAVYAEFFTKNRRLYGMPDLNDCIDGIVKEHSLGAMIQKLWMNAELQAIHMAEARKLIESLRAEVDSLKQNG